MIELAERCPGLKSVCVSNCSHLTDQVEIIVVIVIVVIVVVVVVIFVIITFICLCYQCTKKLSNMSAKKYELEILLGLYARPLSSFNPQCAFSLYAI